MPSTPLRVDLYRGMMPVDSTTTDMNGAFRFRRQHEGTRFEIHIDLGNGLEYVEQVHFLQQNMQVAIVLRPERIRRTQFADDNNAGDGTIISLASLKVPKKAAKEFKKALRAARKKKYEGALGRLQKATEIYPEYAEAFNEMGVIYRRQNQKEEARKAFEQAIAADPKWVSSYLNLASLQQFDNKPQQLLATSNKILKLYPTLSQGHFFYSYANLSMGRLEEAEKSALAADRHEHPQVPQIHLVLADIYRHRGELAKAEKQLRAFLRERPRARNADHFRAQIKKLQQQAKAQGERAEQ